MSNINIVNLSSYVAPKVTEEKNKEFVLSLPKREEKNFEDLFNYSNPKAIDLL